MHMMLSFRDAASDQFSIQDCFCACISPACSCSYGLLFCLVLQKLYLLFVGREMLPLPFSASLVFPMLVIMYLHVSPA